ncbi:hypothetical protein [Halobacillus salinus]|uniref:hypothetical protein n=1 Tax=Halobacillus salinus TaxID=192814 RepID=UPI001590F382|nr:hypothetical protein [Halobacillus salinus]
MRQELSFVPDLIEQYGNKATESVLSNIEQDNLETVNSSTKRDFKSLSEVMEAEQEIPTSTLEYFKQLQNYMEIGNGADTYYKSIDFKSIGSSAVNMYGLNGGAEDVLNQQYKKAEQRKKELVGNQEHLSFFFNGFKFEMHTLLFKDLGRFLLFEAMVLTVLISAYITTFEFENRTDSTLFSTKRGRKLMKDKWIAACISSFTFSSLLFTISLAIYFLMYDYRGVFFSSFSNIFMAETELPYITWWNLTFLEYLFFFIGTGLLLQTLFSSLTYLLSIKWRNSYYSYIAFAILFGAFTLLAGLIPGNTVLFFAGQFTPFTMMMNPQTWFTINNPLTVFPFYEAATITTWGTALTFLCYTSYRRFLRQSLI